MKLRKLDWWEVPRLRSRVVVVPVKETAKETVRVESPDLEALKKDVEKLKKKRPEYVGGSGSVGSYHQVTSNEVRFAKHSFQPGINVIGVASGMPTTVWLPADSEHNHLVAVKDELGVATQQPITVRVYT